MVGRSHPLDPLLRPASLALVGATDKPGKTGATLMEMARFDGFAGEILPVNPRLREIAGHLCHPSLASLPKVPDMAVICTPPEPIPGLIDELGARGTRAAIVLTAGLDTAKTPEGLSVS